MTEIVKFNVGGQCYQVSRALLQMHPNTMLAKSASKQWQQDPEAEIFIERDGQIFRFVLAYLRDAKVTLPITESMETFIAELEYYCIEGDKDKIDEKALQKAMSIQAIKMTMQELIEESQSTTLAILCLEIYLNVGVYSKEKLHKFCLHEEAEKKNVKLETPNSDVIKKVNLHLHCIGLHLKSVKLQLGFYKNVQIRMHYAEVEEIDMAKRKKNVA